MKKLLTVVFTMLLAASLSFAQNAPNDTHKAGTISGGPSTPLAKTGGSKEPSGKKSGKKGHKGGKKHKKGQGDTTSQVPK